MLFAVGVDIGTWCVVFVDVSVGDCIIAVVCVIVVGVTFANVVVGCVLSVSAVACIYATITDTATGVMLCCYY